jgi:biotin carboxylase
MSTNLAEFKTEGPGVHTTLAFHRRVPADPVLHKGAHTTAFLQSRLGGSTDDPT